MNPWQLKQVKRENMVTMRMPMSNAARAELDSKCERVSVCTHMHALLLCFAHLSLQQLVSVFARSDDLTIAKSGRWRISQGFN